MLRQVSEALTVPTPGRGFTEITSMVAAWVARTGIHTGLLTLHLQHTSASLLIQENADPDVRRDLEVFFARWVPEGDPRYRHAAEGPDDMPAHIRAAVLPVQLSIPIEAGTMLLGTWQGIYVWEHRRCPHRRRIVLHLMGE